MCPVMSRLPGAANCTPAGFDQHRFRVAQISGFESLTKLRIGFDEQWSRASVAFALLT